MADPPSLPAGWWEPVGRCPGERRVPVSMVTVQKRRFPSQGQFGVFSARGRNGSVAARLAVYINSCLICLESLLLIGPIISVWERI